MNIKQRSKVLFLLGLVLIALPLSYGALAQGKAEEISIRVDGLSCPFCAYGLEKKLKRLEGAESIHIDIDLGIARIRLHEGKKIEEKDLKKAVEDAGFSAREITYGTAQK